MGSILIFFQCASNTGYAIDSLEKSFLDMARKLVGSDSRIHLAYPDLSGGKSKQVPEDFQNLLVFDPTTADSDRLDALAGYVRRHQIDFALGVDQPPGRAYYPVMRRAGVEAIVAYWGAPMSSLNRGFRLLLKKLEMKLARRIADHFIFESHAMARTATQGRGIPPEQVSVVHLGVDPHRFAPDRRSDGYLQREFGIPRNRRVAVYSGHFEERKGVEVLVRAAAELVDRRDRRDFHLLLLGNDSGQERALLRLLEGTRARDHVTFGGYRNDVPDILPHCEMGTIGSIGWDSFTMSSLEMAAAGLPLVVSDLQGLRETVEDGETGFLFPPGDHVSLADRIETILDEPERRAAMSAAARRRILDHFTTRRQVDELARLCQEVYESAARDRKST